MTLVILKQSYKTAFGCLIYKEAKHQLQVEKKKKSHLPTWFQKKQTPIQSRPLEFSITVVRLPLEPQWGHKTHWEVNESYRMST